MGVNSGTGKEVHTPKKEEVGVTRVYGPPAGGPGGCVSELQSEFPFLP